jgi:hypothetical protein
VDVADDEEAGDRDADARPEREERRRLHLHRRRPGLDPPSPRRVRGLVEQVGARGEDGAAGAHSLEPGEELAVGGDPAVGPERAAGAVAGERALDPEQLPELELGIERAAGADADRPLHAELGELGEHDRGARPADPGRLDAEAAPLLGLAAVAPEAAVQVVHLRLGQELLRQRHRPRRIAGEQHVGGDRAARAQVDRHRG